MRTRSKAKAEVNPKEQDFEDIMGRIKKVESLPFKVSACVYGRSGTGKTTFACTFPKPLLIIDIKEEGTDSVVDVEGVEVVSVDLWQEFEQLYWFLKSKSGRKYKTVVIDTVSQLQELALMRALELEGKDMDSFPTKHTWGTAASILKPWIIHFRDLPMNVVFTAQDRVTDLGESEESEDQMIPEVGPRLMPSVAAVVNAAVKCIGNTHIKEVTRKNEAGKLKKTMEYRLRIGPHAFYLTKIRHPKTAVTPQSLINPSYEDLVKIIKGDFQVTKKSPETKKGTDKE